MNIILTPLKLAIGASLLASSLLAQNFKVLTPPDPNSIPLMVLEAKQKEFLGTDTLQIAKAPSGDISAMKAIMNDKKVDVALFNFIAGGKFYSQGIDHLRLAGVHVWGGVGILSKKDIVANDWAALKGTRGLSLPAIKTPPHMFGMAAMKKYGLNPKKDIKVAGMGPAVAFNTMSRKNRAPSFVLAPEPLLSIVLFKQQKENWEQKYHLFADSAKAITGNSGTTPLGAFWIVNDKKNMDNLIYGFEKAITFINNPKNKKEVAKIVAKGFKKHFGQKVPPKVFENVLDRGVLKLNFKDAKFVKGIVTKFWKSKGIKVDDKIFYNRQTGYKIPTLAIFTAQMMPKLVGGTLSNIDSLKFSKETISIAWKIKKINQDLIIPKAIEVGKLERELFDLSIQKGTKSKVGKLIKEISKLKEEISFIQLDCIEMVKEQYPKNDLKKLINFFKHNKDFMYQHHKVSF